MLQIPLGLRQYRHNPDRGGRGRQGDERVFLLVCLNHALPEITPI